MKKTKFKPGDLVYTNDEEQWRTDRERCLNDAKKCVCGDRDKQYGCPEDNFTLIADLWTTYLHEHMYDPKCELQPVDVANMMCLFKLGRITTSPNGGTYDSYVDLAGYAACGAEIISNVKGDGGVNVSK